MAGCTLSKTLALTVFLAVLTGCSATENLFSSKEETRLEGERVSILELQKKLEPDSDVLDAQGFIAPSPWRNEFWPQEGGYPNHAMQHAALGPGPLTKLWEADIGDGARSGLPLTAQPIVVDGKVFSLDSQSRLTAFATATGRKLWTVNVQPRQEKDPAISGGIAYSRGRLYVTSGYGEVLALSPDNGSLIWRAAIPAPSRAAPTLVEERIFVQTIDNRIVALSTENGEILWEFAGIEESTTLVGAPSPAASRDIVVPAFSSGEVFALRVENGSVAWGENLTSFRAAAGITGISDIQGLPVIDKGLVIVISYGGRMMAIDERTGSRVWQRDIGSAETPWVAGNHLFVISNDSELVALGRDNGNIRWVTELPKFESESGKKKVFWYGPVLAGARLIIAGSNGEIREIAPETGKLIRNFSVKAPVTMTPIVAGEVLYLLAADGTLLAYK